MKICTTCNKEKETKDFFSIKKRGKELRDVCKKCEKSVQDKKYKEKMLEFNSSIESFTCHECKIEKPNSDFTSNKKYCRSCLSIYNKEKRQKNIEAYRESDRKNRRAGIEWLRDFKKVPCKDCNKIFSPELMDFDHVSGEKNDNVSRMVLSGRSEKIILEEIDKCEIVCCICHTVRTRDRYAATDTRGYDGLKNAVIKNLKYIDECKNVPCSECNNKYEICSMEFDHIDKKDKIANICNLKSVKFEILKAEIEKCRVICVMCHRKRSLTEQLQKYEDKKNGVYNPDNEPREKPVKKVRVKSFIDYENKKKECFYCKQIKDFDLFTLKKNKSIKYSTYCTGCINEYRRDKRKERKEAKEKLNNEKKPIVIKKEKIVKEILFIDYDNKKKECSHCRDIKDFDGFFICKDRKLENNIKCRDCLNSDKRMKRNSNLAKVSQ